jgi:hypothetical protein
VAALQASITSEQFAAWMAYYEVEPWGEDRADLRMGILASATVAPHCRRGQAPKPASFLPKFGPRKPQSEELMKAEFRRAMAGFAKSKR